MTGTAPQLEVLETAEALADRSAQLIVEHLSNAVNLRGHASFAVSGGRTPAKTFAIAAREALPWERLDLFQVDERVAPEGHADRNATAVRSAFAKPYELYPQRFHWMPVEQSDLTTAASDYERTIKDVAGQPAVLDLIHLGLGDDGHTASLFPGAPPTDVAAHDVAVTDVHLGRRRMTLTMAAINRARIIVWIISGRDKQPALKRLLARDPDLVASHVRHTGVVILADRAAAGAAL